jgi:ACS family D-galactonate transporter-like MFS transporter
MDRQTRLHVLVSLLVVSIILNYVDRSNLSIAAPVIERELSLSPAQLGTLFSAFFWTYALVQLFGIAGWVSDRFPVGVVLGTGFLLWSAATIVTGMVWGLTALFAARLVLGAAESIAYPCYSRILATDVPPERRGVPNALIDAGSKVGPAVGSFVGAMLVASIGWRVFFIGLGALSLLWLIPWWIWMPRSAAAHADQSEAGPPVARILACRPAWGTFLGHFCGNYFWFFLLTWLPTYFVQARGFSMDRMGTLSMLAYLIIATATVISGWLSDRWIRSGASETRVRKTIIVTGLLTASTILPVAGIQSQTVSVALLYLSCAGFGIYVSSHWATTQTLAGPAAAGRWTGIQNGVGNLAGIAASWLTGVAVERTGSFHLAFVIASAVAVTGAFMWGAVVGPVREVDWTV